MEEETVNNKKKMKPLHIILIVAGILIIVLGLYNIIDEIILKSSNKNNQSTVVKEADKQEEKDDDKEVETDSNVDSNTEEVVNYIEVEEYVPATEEEREALELGEGLWKYAHSAYWGSEPAWNRANRDCSTAKMEEVKAKFTSDFIGASENFRDETKDYEMDIDEFVHCEAGRGSRQLYKETQLIVKEIQDAKIVYTARSLYCDTPFCIDYKGIVKIVEKEFIIKKQNDNWLISYFYLPN